MSETELEGASAPVAEVIAWLCENCGTAKLPRLWELDYCERCYVRDDYDEPFFEGTWDEIEARWDAICAERYPSLASTPPTLEASKDA